MRQRLRSSSAPAALQAAAHTEVSFALTGHRTCAKFKNSGPRKTANSHEKTRLCRAAAGAKRMNFARRNWDPSRCVQNSKFTARSNGRRAEHDRSQPNGRPGKQNTSSVAKNAISDRIEAAVVRSTMIKTGATFRKVAPAIVLRNGPTGDLSAGVAASPSVVSNLHALCLNRPTRRIGDRHAPRA
jgi:hypothetical protein